MNEVETTSTAEAQSLLRSCQQVWTRLRNRVKDEKAVHVNRRETVDDISEHVRGYLSDDRRIIQGYFGDPGITADLDNDMRALLVLTRARSLKSKYLELLASINRGFGRLEHQVFDRDFGALMTTRAAGQEPPASLATVQSGDRVFVVHGHDEAAKQSVARFLEQLGLKPIILHEQASRGRTIIEKVELNSDVRFAVVVLTPDDFGAAKTQGASHSSRARQNAVFEWGYLIAKLGRENVCALRVSGVELPSDLNGVVFTEFDNRGAWRTELARELRGANVRIDANRLIQ